ncbi:TraR/DksA family transcriptional regulator [Kineobactrum salinum]|uniref:TraR/DksA family transcriptional regulator n=1 Tax=Kineobactrum salinum TaxID=2708301 RepID=A0A6C0U5E4_9GAMM|nr:TraR/DksA C4-type zinc finger protein [Kineobactrum salinum]QIB66207.1 TraR/DksA family transcriptional regulator [Kineobactrum salinum]
MKETSTVTNAALKRQLEEKLARLQERLERIRRDIGKEHSLDAAEQAQERENDEVVDAIGVETAQSLREVQAALARLEAGSYGICERCGEEIAPARLAVLPEAVLCVNCAA